MNLILLQILNTIATLIEVTYDLGVFTRRHVLPLILYIIVGVHYITTQYIVPQLNNLIDILCDSVDHNLKVYPTPLTTGLAHC